MSRNPAGKEEAMNAIRELFEQAAKAWPKKDMANNYVALARQVAKRNNLRIPSHLKRQFCKGCGSFLKQGSNVTVRTQDKAVIYKCHECGKLYRIPFIKELKARKRKV